MLLNEQKRAIELIEKHIVPAIEGRGYEVVEVSFALENDEDNLYIFIHKKGGVSLDDCVLVNSIVDPLLEQVNPTFDKPYVLNVSSPGLDRPIKTDRDFARNIGEEVELKLYAGVGAKKQKVFVGVLQGKSENGISILTKDGERVFPASAVAHVVPYINFNSLEGDSKNEQ